MELPIFLLFLLSLLSFSLAEDPSVCAQTHASPGESYSACCQDFDGKHETIDGVEYIYHCSAFASTTLTGVPDKIDDPASCAKKCSGDTTCKGTVWDADRSWQKCWLVKYQTKAAGANTHVLSMERVDKIKDCTSEADAAKTAAEATCKTEKDALQRQCDEDKTNSETIAKCQEEKEALQRQCDEDKATALAAQEQTLKDQCQPKIDAAVSKEYKRWEGCYDECYPWPETVAMYCGKGTSDGGLTSTPRNWYKWACKKTWDKKYLIDSYSTIKRPNYYQCLQGCDDMKGCQGTEARETGCYYYSTSNPTKRNNGKTFALVRHKP